MRNIFVPHFGHIPVIAALFIPPLPFIVTSLASLISLFALHFTQYASIIILKNYLIGLRPLPDSIAKILGGLLNWGKLNFFNDIISYFKPK